MRMVSLVCGPMTSELSCAVTASNSLCVWLVVSAASCVHAESVSAGGTLQNKAYKTEEHFGVDVADKKLLEQGAPHCSVTSSAHGVGFESLDSVRQRNGVRIANRVPPRHSTAAAAAPPH